MERQIRVRLPVDLYEKLARMAVAEKTSVSNLLCRAAELVIQNAPRSSRGVPGHTRHKVCLDPNKMNGAGDQFPGTDEGSQYDRPR